MISSNDLNNSANTNISVTSIDQMLASPVQLPVLNNSRITAEVLNRKPIERNDLTDTLYKLGRLPVKSLKRILKDMKYSQQGTKHYKFKQLGLKVELKNAIEDSLTKAFNCKLDHVSKMLGYKNRPFEDGGLCNILEFRLVQLLVASEVLRDDMLGDSFMITQMSISPEEVLSLRNELGCLSAIGRNRIITNPTVRPTVAPTAQFNYNPLADSRNISATTTNNSSGMIPSGYRPYHQNLYTIPNPLHSLYAAPTTSVTTTTTITTYPSSSSSSLAPSQSYANSNSSSSNSNVVRNVPIRKSTFESTESTAQKFNFHKINVTNNFAFAYNPSYCLLKLLVQPQCVKQSLHCTEIGLIINLSKSDCSLIESTSEWLLNSNYNNLTLMKPEVGNEFKYRNDCFYSMMMFVGNGYDFKLGYPYECSFSIDDAPFNPVPFGRHFGKKVSLPIDFSSHLLSSEGRVRDYFKVNFKFSFLPSDYYFFTYLVLRIPPISMSLLSLSTPSLLCAKEEVKKKYFSDSEIKVEKTTLGLRDPLLCTPLKVPVRGLHCNHLACFDICCWLSYNMMSYEYSCPICNLPLVQQNEPILQIDTSPNASIKMKLTGSGDLLFGVRVCMYTIDIIKASTEDECCVIDGNGEWILVQQNEDDDDYDDDSSDKQEKVIELDTSESSNKKRKLIHVIDLTLD